MKGSTDLVQGRTKVNESKKSDFCCNFLGLFSESKEFGGFVNV